MHRQKKIEVYGDSVSAGEVTEAVDYTGKTDLNIREVILTAGIPMPG